MILLAGVDVGSTGLKVALYVPDGRRVATPIVNMPSTMDQTAGHSEPYDLVAESTKLFKELSAQFELKQVACLGISSANAMVLTDEHFSAVFPAIMQLDKRGAEMVAQVGRELGDDWLFSRTGNRNAPGYQWGPTLKWLQTYEGERLAQAKRLCNPTSYLAARLTGKYTMDITRAATTLLYCPETGVWDGELWRYFGLLEVEQPALLPPHALLGHTLDGCGLPQGIPVATGGIDTICAMLGLSGGTPGDVLIMGSVGRFAAAVSQWGLPLFKHALLGRTPKNKHDSGQQCGHRFEMGPQPPSFRQGHPGRQLRPAQPLGGTGTSRQRGAAFFPVPQRS